MMFTLRSADEEFINRPGGSDAGSGLWILLVALIGLMGGFVFWAANFEIEEVTRASGRVVPSAQLQLVQSLEGGVVAAIAVQEGDVVEQGQVLFQIDDTSVQSSLGELEQRSQAFSAELVRLRAEARGAQDLEFSDPSQFNSKTVAAELAIFDTRRQQLSLEVDVLRERLAQRRAELGEIAANKRRLNAMYDPLEREVEISEELFEEGTLSEIEILRLRAKLAEIGGDLGVLSASESRAAAAVSEIETQISSAFSAYELVAKERISVVLTDLAVVEEMLTAARDRVSRTALRSPLRGTVNRISVSNVGSVVQPGSVMAEIVPLEETVLIEAQVKPRDVAFVRVGAPASIKITAYDFLRYGDLAARVERIGADALQSEDGATYFQVMLRTQEMALTGSSGEALAISPGMVASVDIQSGRKTVLEYLIQPVLRAQHEALRER
ncbi:MAG: HlyD family type I secretion periplasmic adaptor subunit [Pseudomonadota bacterium]